MNEGLLDRLKLTPERIEAMAEGLRQIVALEDPCSSYFAATAFCPKVSKYSM